MAAAVIDDLIIIFF